MSEFRAGNKAKSHPYPSTRGNGASVNAFARNFASGPALDTAVPGAGVQIPWNVIDSGAPAGVNVPITAHVTGRFLVSGTVALENTSASSVTVQVEVQGNSISNAVPASARVTLGPAPAEAVYAEVIPFETLVVGLPIGVLFNIQIFVSANDDVTTLNLVAESCTLEIQEITGAQ